MAAAAIRVASLSRAACRREFEERFSVTSMVSAYERVYEAALVTRTEKRKQVSAPGEQRVAGSA